MNDAICNIVENEKDIENNNSDFSNHNDKNQSDDNNDEKRERSIFKTITVMIIAVTIVIVASILIGQFIEPRYIPFLNIGIAAIIGYFVVNSLANLFYNLTYSVLKNNAKAVRILIRIVGAIIVISIIISYLSQDPIVAASIGTITGIVIGFASQNVLGNLISGLYLAIIRPFRIGQKVTVFGNTGVIYDIGLLYSRLQTDEGDTILAPNTLLVTTTIIVRRS